MGTGSQVDISRSSAVSVDVTRTNRVAEWGRLGFATLGFNKPLAFESDNNTVALNNLHRGLYTWWTLYYIEGAEYEEVAEHGEGWGVIGGEEQGVRGRPETVAAVSAFASTSRMLAAVLLPWAKPHLLHTSTKLRIRLG